MNIKRLMPVIEHTPNDQPILLNGIHGVGKSQVIQNYFESKGYEVVSLFLGQMADAGDLIGLPQISDGYTEFCPPKWWKQDKPLVLFLDEINRARPDILQVVMDLVLNRKLNGKSLPETTKVIAAMNPSNSIYSTEELDPALRDRFNIYNFEPSTEEWIDWAVKADIDRSVIGFISKNSNLLDPPTKEDEYNPDAVYPSRRSWERVSNLCKNTEISDDVLTDMLIGMIGASTTAKFIKYRKDNSGLTAGKLLINWTPDTENVLKTMDISSLDALSGELIRYVDENSNLINKDNPNGVKIANNLENYMNSVTDETVGSFFNKIMEKDNIEKHWEDLFDINPEIGKKFQKILDISDDVNDNPAE